MKLGIITNNYTLENLNNIKNKNLEFVEFCINYNENVPDSHTQFLSQITEIKNNLNSAKLEVGSVGRWGGFKILPNGKINSAELDIDKALIDAAKTLGSEIYVTGCNYISEHSLFDNYRDTIFYFHTLIAYAKEKDIKIAVYNCRWNNYIVCDPAWSAILSNIKDLYIKYDPSHCIYDGGDYLHEMAKWGSRIIHIHLKGSLTIDGKRYDDPPAGLDQTDWPKFFALLYKLGYNRTLSIEPHSPTWKDELGDKGVQFTIDYMKKLIF
ncbi:sugar phosphate isomerase/epimerase family protein [Candidatus Epulonipiscium viviparus]|uniref:sugar phosphate isomerase/epimerase family protein n=1 Tax=Candidatus Epulonipiscium viviparus TaxID=420336 RepID=UPI0027380B4B|nr:sugar phosphate isomerase/epimerase [Candidatus Epulopiscium viviparus]